MSGQEPARASQGVPTPDYLTDRQWAILALEVLTGAANGVDRADLPGEWGSDLGIAALRGVKERLDELMGPGSAEAVPDA
ncbi:hypothetical protein ABT160_28655 [Streptomyces sp. NPDC001941]|uniref:hypothetical protein n=1 Tax=Streptomyces sp. NPDC001941 TaxID=3154659 RepID=UPI00333015C9